MGRLSAVDATKKYVKNGQNASSDYVKGIENVTESPMEKAAQAKDKMKQNLIEAIDNGKYEAGLRRWTLTAWKERTKTLGGTRYSSGIKAAEGKMLAFMQEWLPFQDTISAELNQMDNITFQDSIDRMIHQVTRAKDFKRTT